MFLNHNVLQAHLYLLLCNIPIKLVTTQLYEKLYFMVLCEPNVPIPYSKSDFY